MERTIRIFLPVTGEPRTTMAAFLDEPIRWLPEGRFGARGLLSTVRAGGIGKRVLVRVGSSWSVGATQWRSLHWDPLHEDGGGPTDRLLPSFEGELGLHVIGSGRITLVLDGRYVPPGGSVGAAIDGVAMGRVANRSLERFLADLAARLQQHAAMADAPG